MTCTSGRSAPASTRSPPTCSSGRERTATSGGVSSRPLLSDRFGIGHTTLQVDHVAADVVQITRHASDATTDACLRPPVGHFRRRTGGLPGRSTCRTLARVTSARSCSCPRGPRGLAAVQPLAAPSDAASVETVRVAPGGTVRIVVTGGACAAGKTVIVSGKPIASAVRRNGLGILRVKAGAGRIRVSFRVPADTGAGPTR